MLLRKLRLLNYGGIYNGMHLYEINIDFTKCKNRLIIIRGDNGSGKSTIEGALKPLPDDNSCFIQGKTALKEIEYYDEFTNIIYSIRFIHECKPDGSRSNTKGYIQKIIVNSGEVIELNPSGNISSCKEIIYEEFQLDPNYVTLIQLSNAKRGLADMRPADRKRYVNSILSTTEVYNDMHKKLSKKSTAYKSLMNTVVSKLDTIGDPGKLQSELNSIQENIDKLSTMNSNAISNRASAEGSLREIDPDNYIDSLMVETDMKLSSLNSKKQSYEKTAFAIPYVVPRGTRELPSTMDGINDRISDIDKLYGNAQKDKRAYEEKIKSYNSEIERIMSEREITATEFQTKSNKLRNLSSGLSIDQLKSMREQYKERIMTLQKRWDGVVSLNNITRDEIVMVIDTMRSIHSQILEMKSFYELSTFTEAINLTLDQNYSEAGMRDELRRSKEKLVEHENHLKDLESTLIKINSMSEVVAILNQRPSECKIDTCPLIKNALDAQSQLKSFKEQSSIENEISNTRILIGLAKDDINRISTLIDLMSKINSLYKTFNNINKPLSKIKIGNNRNMYREFQDIFLQMLQNENSLEYGFFYDNLYKYLDYANDFEEYRVITNDLERVKSQLIALSSQEELIELLSKDIERLSKKLDEDQIVIDNLRSEVFKASEAIVDIDKNSDELMKAHDVLKAYLAIIIEISELNKTMEKYKEKINKIQYYKGIITQTTEVIGYSDRELKPLLDRRDNINYLLNLYAQYQQELAEYKGMYDKIETLKHYSSPTTGIQLLFASIYMNKIMDKANSLIINLFRGEFALLPFVINDVEFRIPVAVNNGINHADITNMSSAQIALISMIISISLLSQTSTRLNIIVGDEIDAPFDSGNRREFLSILSELMTLVQSSQCVLISHNSEIDLKDCDVIVLRSENEIINEGNVIWNYNEFA